MNTTLTISCRCHHHRDRVLEYPSLGLTIPIVGFTLSCVTWGELIRKLRAAGYVEQRSGKGSHRQFIHPTTGHVITVAVHTKKEVGTGLANRILKEAGLK
jgi:predicted RNA binding protein YcfA (HicA-like mRNA interferase family)